jgi:hypothetical protein
LGASRPLDAAPPDANNRFILDRRTSSFYRTQRYLTSPWTTGGESAMPLR